MFNCDEGSAVGNQSENVIPPVQMLFPRVGPVVGTALKLCEQGAHVLCDHALLIDEKCMVAFDLTVNTRRRRINAWGEVAHVARQVDGRTEARIRFVDMDAGCRLAIKAWQFPG